LERSCTAEFSGFLLYKELGRRLKVNTTTTTTIHIPHPQEGRKKVHKGVLCVRYTRNHGAVERTI